jgi:hypothetical protein
MIQFHLLLENWYLFRMTFIGTLTFIVTNRTGTGPKSSQLPHGGPTHHDEWLIDGALKIRAVGPSWRAPLPGLELAGAEIPWNPELRPSSRKKLSGGSSSSTLTSPHRIRRLPIQVIIPEPA